MDRAGGWRCAALAALAAAAAAAAGLSGCALVSAPTPGPDHLASLAPPGAVGYVVCPDEVTPVELTTRTAEPAIRLPLSGSPALGDFAITTSPDGRWAYVVTGDGVGADGPAAATTAGSGPGSTAVTGQNMVIPIDLVTQQAGSPIRIPGRGATHAIVVIDGGRTVLAASGNTIVPVDASSHRVGTPLDLGPGRTVFGLAPDPGTSTVFALVPGGVIPVDTAHATAAKEIPTFLSVSSVASPHGMAVTGDGRTLYVVGQGGTDFGGRVLPITVATGALGTMTGFDRYGIADPAAVAVNPEGTELLVADGANNWINPVSVAHFTDPAPPVRLDPRPRGNAPGTGHPTDIVFGPGRTGAFVVDGFDAVIPYQPGAVSVGRPIPVCSGASSMVVAPAA